MHGPSRLIPVRISGPVNRFDGGHGTSEDEKADELDAELARAIADCDESPASLNKTIQDGLEAASALLPVCTARDDN